MNENVDRGLHTDLTAPVETIQEIFARHGIAPLHRCACGKVISQNKAKCLGCVLDEARDRLDKEL